MRLNERVARLEAYQARQFEQAWAQTEPLMDPLVMRLRMVLAPHECAELSALLERLSADRSAKPTPSESAALCKALADIVVVDLMRASVAHWPAADREGLLGLLAEKARQ